jgi:hypothetical protein
MNKIKYIAAVFIAIAGLGLQQAQATLGVPSQFTLTSPLGSPTAETNYLIKNFGQQSDLTFLFKLNNDGTTDGSLGAFFTITQTSSSLWTVSWNLTNASPCFTLESVLIKDGTIPVGDEHQQLYRFYPVIDNEGTIGAATVTFDNPVKGISHISFFGSPCVPHVPDGGTTVMLLGAGLSGLGLVGRFLKR